MLWIISLAVIAADILVKRYAAAVWSKAPLVLIDGVLELTYVENRGAAWGIFQGARLPFIVLTVLFLTVLIFLYCRKKKELNTLSVVILALIFAGAFGNLIDRAVYGYVRDMIYVSLIRFPVFNIADSAIVIGACLLILQTLFMKNGIYDVLEKAEKARRDKRNGAEP